MARYLLLFTALTLVFAGCVSRGAYEENIGNISGKLKAEKTARSTDVKILEQRLADRGKTLSDLTGRYIMLKAEKDSAQSKLDGLKADLDALMKDMSELKLVIFTNMRGSEANEMMIKLNNMQKRVDRLLTKEAEMKNAAPAPPPDEAPVAPASAPASP
ncbi:MAG: hypothetical protein HY955_09485 [Deltaproteobacteria bacterium]|nr:hypothetical protein [Deltaproteobacteria bacterium]